MPTSKPSSSASWSRASPSARSRRSVTGWSTAGRASRPRRSSTTRCSMSSMGSPTSPRSTTRSRSRRSARRWWHSPGYPRRPPSTRHSTRRCSRRRSPTRCPPSWTERHGLRRFGFHGLSVEWATGRAAELLETPSDDLALVVAHLGSGCSVTAVDAGRSAWTSMGMTPLEGLMMGTRSGSVDPGILVRLLHAGVTPDELDEGLEHGSGLLGVAGSADMRELLERETGGDERRRAGDRAVRAARRGMDRRGGHRAPAPRRPRVHRRDRRARGAGPRADRRPAGDAGPAHVARRFGRAMPS